MSKTKLYLAGPLFNPAERELSEQISSILSRRFEVYLPHVHGSILPNLISQGVEPELARRKIFSDDCDAIRQCEVLLIILNGRAIDEGAAFELGVGWSLGKKCFGYKDDFRQLTASGDNPMIEEALTKIFFNLVELKEWALRFEG